MKLIDYYHEWEKNGCFPNHDDALGDGGLCNAIPKSYQKDLELFEPTSHKNLNPRTIVYWGCEERVNKKTIHEFNDFRKNVVLFICAINNEL